MLSEEMSWNVILEGNLKYDWDKNYNMYDFLLFNGLCKNVKFFHHLHVYLINGSKVMSRWWYIKFATSFYQNNIIVSNN